MTRRLNGGDQDGQDHVKGQLKQLFDDDAFLTDLSRGVDPSEGSDALAGLLLDLTKEAQEPPAAMPDWSTLLPGVLDQDQDSPVESTSDTTVMQASSPATQEFAPVSISDTPDNATNEADSGTVVPLAARREKRAKRGTKSAHTLDSSTSQRRSHPFLHGLVGAAAATLVIAGGGAAVYNADESSPLYGMNQQFFGNQDSPSVVELASTLEEVDSRTASGDVEGARALLEQARAMLDSMDNRRAPAEEVPVTQPAPAPETLTATVTETASPEPPVTETQTVTSTQVQTVTTTAVAPPVWTPNPEPTATTTTPLPGDGQEGGNDGDSGLVPPQTPGN
ncbi:hypothetical protein N24_0740 [Corynebacterium suranareeae]|uniref:Anti-sigma-D factor RsdA sigma factor binding region domain-containing protein n=1 Tax=Corynebacterium suranareeae TaxID=2506452 RepID=A0A169RR32_9CORY|nr:hypothetical protein [Corynebacterium suranareeae]BAU95002.1 hypothetical protein N24_0740 [Corynebacterium suranareeae]